MNTFSRIHQPATQPKKIVDEERCTQVTPLQAARELLNNPVRSALLAQIKVRANAPPGLYQKYYYELIESVAEFYQELPGVVPPFNCYGGLLDQALHRCAKLLEERLDHRFPADDAPQEQVDEEYSLWTYMLFTVGLMRDIGKLHNCYQVYLCDADGMLPRRWLPYDGCMRQISNYYRFKRINTELVKLDPSQWDKRAGPNLAYRLMPSECFNWIHGNTAAYRIWWYELSDEEEDGRGGKSVKLALASAEAKAVEVAVSIDSEMALKEFVESAEQEQQQKDSNQDLPTLTVDPSQVNAANATEATLVVWAADQISNNGAAASQIQAHSDGTMSITGAGIEAFAQTFPQVGDTTNVHTTISNSAMNTANNTRAATQTNSSPTTNPVSQMNSAVAQQSTTAQIQQIAQKQTGVAAIVAIAAVLAARGNVATPSKMPQVESQASSVRMTMSRGS